MACSICRHAAVEAINDRLARGESPLQIAGDIDVAKSIVYRHRAECIGEMVARSMLTREAELTASIEQRFRAIVADTADIFDRATASNDDRLAAWIIKQRLQNLQLEAVMLKPPAASGLCDECDTLGYPKGWPELKTRLLNALEPHPDAKAAIAAALNEKENEA